MDASTTLLYGIILLHLLSGLTIGTVVSQKLNKKDNHVDAWLETLKAGGSQSPIELAKLQVLISLQMHHLKLLLNISLI